MSVSFALFFPIKKVTFPFSASQRDECIRYALQAEGIKTNNPKIPVTDNFICTGGQTPFRDHIACTGMLLHQYTLTLRGAFSSVDFELRVLLCLTVQVTPEVPCSRTTSTVQYRWAAALSQQSNCYHRGSNGPFCPQVALVSWGTQSLCKSGELKESVKNSRDFHLNLFKVTPFLKGILGNNTQDEYAPLRFLST